MDMATSVDSMIHLTRDSSSRSRNTLVKSVYLKRLKKHLAKDPEYVFSRLQTCIDTLHKPSNFRVYVAANIQTLSNPVSAWKALLNNHDDSTPLQPLDSRKSKLSEISKKPGNTAYIIPLSTIDSSYALLTSRGPDSWSHPDLPALMVAQSYLDAVEGPLWAAVRGTGLAYGTGFSRSVDVGLLTLRIYRSPDTFKAFLAAKTEVENYATGTTPFDKFALEGAVSSIIMGFADEQPTMGSAANLSFVNQVIRGIPKNWNDEMLEKVRRVNEDEIKDVLKRLIMPIFNPESTNLVITCATIMEEVCFPPSQKLEGTITNLSHRISLRLSQMQDSSLKSRHCRTLKTTTDSRTLKALKTRKRKTRKRKKMMRKKEMAAKKMIQRVRMKSRLLL
jgi:Zn-dependent M16 (insulinase) family peptidase